MPDIDDLLRAAYRSDEPWSGDTEAARREVLRRHRRGTVTRRYVAASSVAAAAAVVMTLIPGDPRGPRGVEPAEQTPSTSAPALPTPLEGRWESAPLGAEEVRAAALAAGAPGAAAAILDDLPQPPFRVVVVVRGASLTTYVEGAGGGLEVLDQESIAVDGDVVTLRPFDSRAETVHTWLLDGDQLTMRFRSTTEGEDDRAVPGEAWQRLLYGSGDLTR